MWISFKYLLIFSQSFFFFDVRECVPEFYRRQKVIYKKLALNSKENGASVTNKTKKGTTLQAL
jgi:hypothetical protein